MRSVVTALIVIACIGGAALAQEAVPFVPQYEERPTGADFALHYPEDAGLRRISGFAVLCCSANADRRLECEARVEYPAGRRFGLASERISSKFRLTEASYAEYLQAPQLIRVPLQFRMDATPGEVERLLERQREVPRDICTAPER